MVLALCCPLLLAAQEHPFIAHYELTELDGAIRIDWSLLGGSCDGQDVERSTDGTSFAAVHRIEGICGGSADPVPYAWTDPLPPEFTTVYYRVKLGAEGFTSVKSVLFDQLTESAQLFFPSPMNGEATLVLNVPSSATTDLFIWDASGRSVHERIGITGSVIGISLPGASAGAYSYRAVSEGRVFDGRFILE